MQISEIELPSGQIIEIEHDDNATQEQLFNFASQHLRTTDDRGTLLGNAAKTFLSGGIEAAINVGAGGAQITAMGIDILDGEMDGINPNMGESVQIMSDVAQRWRKLSMGIDERMGIDPEFANSFGGQVLNGLGQLPVNIAGGIAGGLIGTAVGGIPGGVAGGLIGSGLAIAPQMTTEAIMDAERTLNKKYLEFSNEEMDDAALSALGYTALGSALEYVGLLKSVPQVKRFLRGQLKLPSGEIKEITKSLKREIAEGFAAEGFTEAAQGQLLDSLAAATYDDDRRLMSYDVLANRFNEFLVGGVVGGTAAGATGLFTKREQDVSNQNTKPTGANSFDVVVVDDASGREFIIPIEAAANEEEAIKIAQEGLDAYETKSPDLTFTVTGATPSQGRVEQVIEEPEPEAQPDKPTPKDSGGGSKPELRFHGNKSDKELDKIINGTEIEDVEYEIRTLREIIEETDANDAWLPNAREKTIKKLEVELPQRLERAKRARDRAIIEKQGRADGTLTIMSDDEFGNQAQPEAQPEPAAQPEVQPEPTAQTDLEEESLRQQAEILAGEQATEQDIQSVMSELRTEAQERQAPATPTAQPVPATSVPAPTTAQPQRTGTFQLPKGLRGAKSRYRDATVNFSSDFEKAVYIAGKVKGKKSARFNDYLAELENAGYTLKEIQELRKEMMSDLNYKYQRGDRDIDTVRLTQKDIVAGASTPTVSQETTANDSSRVGTAKLSKDTTQESNIDFSMVPEEIINAQMGKVNYKHLPDDIKNEKDPKVKFEKFVEFIKRNLLYLHDTFPEDLRARATQWYDGANKIANDFASRYGLTVEQVSAVIANLSPQKDWFMNVAQAEQVLHVYQNYQDFTIEGSEIDRNIDNIIDAAEGAKSQKKKKKEGETKLQQTRRENFNKRLDDKAKDKRRKILDLIRGKTIRELNSDKSKDGQILTGWAIRVIAQAEFGRFYQVLSPEGDAVGIQIKLDGTPSMNTWGSVSEITKAVSVIENGSAENISNSLGDQHKVRNFYNNIVAPNSPFGDATIDTHAVAAGLMMPLGASAVQVSHNFGAGKIKNSKAKGISGTYHIYLEAYRRAAKERGLQPRQMQSITWEAIRKVFLPSERNPADIDKATKTWNTSQDENTARNTIIGQRVLEPDWARPASSQGPEVITTGLLGEGSENVIGGSLRFRGRKSGVPTRSESIDRAKTRLRTYGGTISYRAGDGKKYPRGTRTAKGIANKLTAETFVSTARKNKKASRFGASVDILSPKKYNGYDLIRIKNPDGGTVTLSISPQGEVGSVVKSPDATLGDVNAAFDAAIATGKVKFLNGFETVLPDIYAGYGFKPVARLKFDPSKKPEGWDFQTYSKFNNGQPDVIFMRFDGEMNSKYNSEGFPEVQTFEEGVSLSLGEDIEAGGFLGDFFDAGLNPTVDNSMRTPQEQRIEPADDVTPEGYANERELEKAIYEEFNPIAKSLGLTPIFANIVMTLGARYNVIKNEIEFNPRLLIGQSKEYVRAAMREEIIHAVTHEVIKKQGGSWVQFFGQVGRDMNPKERRAVSDVYRNLKEDYEFGAEFYRMIIQQGSYGQITEQFSRNGPAMSKIQKLLKKVQSYMARLLKTIAGEKYQADVMIAQSAALLAQVDPSARPTNQKVIEEATESIAIQTGQREITAGVAAEINTPPSKKKKNKEKLGFMDKYVNTVSRVLSKINPRIAQAFQGYFNTIEAEKNDAIKRVLPFVQKYNAIKSKADKDRLKQLLMYSPLKQDEQPKAELIAERDALLRKYDMYNDLIFGVQPVLSRLRSNAREQGIDVGFLESFFPRRVIDYKGLKDSLGETIADDINLALEQRNAEIETENIAIMERNSKLQPGQKGENLIPKIEKNSPEEALFIEDYIRKAGTSEQFLKNRGISIKIPREELSRRFELIQKEQLEFYDDVPSALESYITNMIVATRTTELMGRRYEELDVTLDPTFEKVRTPGTLSPLISELLESGEINAEDVKTVRNIARMILNPAAKENPLLSGMRQGSYITTLVEFTSTLSQLFDMPFVMYRNGLINTVRGLGMTRDFSLESFGYAKDRVSDEFTDEKSFLNSAAKFGLKAVGFTKLDQIMKESNLAASYLQLRKLARGYYKNRDSKASKKFRLEIEQYNGAENVDATIAALKKGDRDNALVRNFVFAQLLKTQPMSKMQSVAAQSANPNVRFVYQMKSFMIAQLAYTRQEIFDDLFGSNSTTKQRAVALSNLTKLMGFMLLVGLPVDALKDFLAGRLGYLDDYLLNGMVRSFGISKYQFYQIKREGLGQAFLDFITPITVQQGVDYTAELQRVMSGDKALTESKLVSIAPASDVINRLFGFTREKEMKEYRRRLKEGDVPFIRPPGSL